MITAHIKKTDEDIIIELPESTLDTLLSPLADTGSSAGAVPQNTVMQSMMLTGKNVPFPCYKRSNSDDQVVVRISAQHGNKKITE